MSLTNCARYYWVSNICYPRSTRAERVKRAAEKAATYVKMRQVLLMRSKVYELATREMVSVLAMRWDMYANFEVRGDLFIDTVAGVKGII